ncbi:AbrB/MazE/SpoVT family DNA-binding domain-containing protein [Sphingomonas sp. PAMC 26621]|uniref:AbrB/MazE/SpoVT family DNA-binding domain-containing protein n=1 Tax=Sphingomonas sp. PAMC 26621 TaxID=1112213 RepID=UPI0002894148|nr:AbrB/MazE/SpoVT family DNA-binding domain-containing protein [Sphingomonas sp. PAMC 26621]
MTYHAKVIAGGKLVIPADLRRELGIEPGDSLTVDRDEAGHIVLKTRAQVVQEVQSTFRALRGPAVKGSIVDELLAERQEQARLEQQKMDDWLAGKR